MTEIPNTDIEARVAILAPAGSGSKGDEAMIRGALEIFSRARAVLLNPQENTWTDELADISDRFIEQPYSRECLLGLIRSGHDLIVMGADILDGSWGLETSLLRIEAIRAAAQAGRFVAVFFSFNSAPPERLLSAMREVVGLPNVFWFLRDFHSERRFRESFGEINVSYFPDLAFYCPQIALETIPDALEAPVNGAIVERGFIVLNYSEAAFRTLHTSYTDETRLDYVRSVTDPILSRYAGVPVLLVTSDTRGFPNFWSDFEYARLAQTYLRQVAPTTPVHVADPALSYGEIISLMEKARLAVTGQMHLAIAAFRAGCVPVVVAGKSAPVLSEGKGHSMADKSRGMFTRCIGSDELVVDVDGLRNLPIFDEARLAAMTSRLAGKNRDNREEEASLVAKLHDAWSSYRRNTPVDSGNCAPPPSFHRWLRREKIRRGELMRQLKETADQASAHVSRMEPIIREQNRLLSEKERQIKELHFIKASRKTARTDDSGSNKDPRFFFRNLWPDAVHQLRLAGDWLCLPFGGARRTFRFRGANWRLDHKPRPVSRSSCEIRISGIFADEAGRAAAQIIIRLGRRLIFAHAKNIPGQSLHPFSVRFTTKPGLKYLTLMAQQQNGEIITLGRRLLYCSETIPRPPQIPLEQIPESVLVAPAEIDLKPTAAPLVSIIIPVYNQTRYTLRCLKAIATHTRDIPVEVVVIDDCSPEPEIALLGEIAGLRVHRNETNQGFILNCNLGAQIARGKYLVFLNNDTQVQVGWLRHLLDVLETKPDAGLVGARLIYPDGWLQEAGGIVWKDGSAANHGHRKNPESPEFNYLKPADYCSGACLLIASDFFSRIGGFDTRYVPAYYEDTDLAFRVRAAGREVYYQPRSVVIHYEGRSNGTSTTGSGVKRFQSINHGKFQARWADALRSQAEGPSDVFRARDRSMRRPVLLLIDHYVPRPDQDAGSRCIAHLVDFFLSRGFTVKFAPDNLVYDSVYTPELEARGVEVIDSRFGRGFTLADWLRDHGRHLDYVVLSRCHVAIKHLDDLELHVPAPRLLYGHDLLSRTLSRSHALTGDPSLLEQAKRWRTWEQAVFPRVQAAYYPSGEEIAELGKTNPALRARLVPLLTFLAPSRPAPTLENLAARENILFVGGFGHPPNLDAMRWFVSEVWPAVIARLPDAKLEIVGSNPPEDLLSLSAPGVRVRGFLSDADLELAYRSARVAIAPLRMGGGVKGKILEALRFDTPMVTTPIGAEGIPGADGAMVVAETADFASALADAYASPALLAALVKSGRSLLAKHYSDGALAEAFAKDIPELRSPPPTTRPEFAATQSPSI